MSLNCEIKKQGTMFIFSAPSGGGKSSVLTRLIKELPNVVISISVTTRAPRGQEKDGVDYYFVDETKFREMAQGGKLYEYVDSDYGPKYGTPREAVDKLLNEGKDVILDLDYPGVEQLRKVAGDRVKAIALIPPSLKELRERLVNRGTDKEGVINKRMSLAEKRIMESQYYDYIIINDVLEDAVEQSKAIILATRAENKNFKNLDELLESVVKDD